MVSLMSMQTHYQRLHVVNHHLAAFTVTCNMIPHFFQLDVVGEGIFGLPNGSVVALDSFRGSELVKVDHCQALIILLC